MQKNDSTATGSRPRSKWQRSARRRSGRRRLLAGLLTLAVLAVIGVTAVIAGNSFDIDERAVTIPTSGGERQGILALPRGAAGPVGLVVFLHGDGPVDATSDGFYRPIWESNAAAGYASLSWSKPGIGGSSGDWLSQSLADRATEAKDAIAWAREQPEIDPSLVGLWSASQGGWVAPAVTAITPDIAFAIAVSPAINWLRQGRFNLLAELDHTGASREARVEAIGRSDSTLALLERGADYAEYAALTEGEPDRMDRRRWGFVSRNFRADATLDLTRLGEEGIPVLLLLGENDRNVDIAETESTYRALLADHLTTVTFPDANHTLATSDIEDNGFAALVVATFTPRAIFAPGYLDAQRTFLESLRGE